MASILDFLGTQKGEEYISLATEKTSESSENVTAAFGMVLPLLLGAMKRNIASPGGLERLNSALDENTSGEDFLNNIKNLDPSELTEKGTENLDKILGTNKVAIFTTVGSILQMKESSVEIISKMAALLLMNVLSTQKHKEKIASSGLVTLVDSTMGSSSKFDASLVDTFLEKSKDGNIIRDVEGQVLGGDKNGKKDGGILGGMLGGK